MAKTKKAPKKIQNYSDIEAMVKEVNDIDVRFLELDTLFVRDFIKVQKKHLAKRKKVKAEALVKIRRSLVSKIRNYSKKHRHDWATKSKITPFGTFGYRLNTPSVKLVDSKKIDEEEACILLDTKFGDLYVRHSVSIDKQSILDDSKKIAAADLEACGLFVDQEDKFFLETEASKVAEAAKQKMKKS